MLAAAVEEEPPDAGAGAPENRPTAAGRRSDRCPGARAADVQRAAFADAAELHRVGGAVGIDVLEEPGRAETAVLNPKPFAVSGRDDRDRGDDTARVGRLEDGGMAEAGDQRVQCIALPGALSQEGVLDVARLADLEEAGRAGAGLGEAEEHAGRCLALIDGQRDGAQCGCRCGNSAGLDVRLGTFARGRQVGAGRVCLVAAGQARRGESEETEGDESAHARRAGRLGGDRVRIHQNLPLSGLENQVMYRPGWPLWRAV